MIIGIFLIIRFTLQRINQIRAEEKKPPQATQNTTAEMVQCQTCGVHLPENEAIKTENGYICSTKCLPQKN